MKVIKSFVLKQFVKSLPAMSRTEREALESGGVGLEAQAFRGAIDWNEVLQQIPGKFSEKEQAFWDTELEEFMPSLDEERYCREGDMPAQTWALIRKNFLGLCVPVEYGGRGFSNYFHARVVERIATRSITAAVTVMVPNSLGPAELLLHYGTAEQKNKYLPKLTSGEMLPCFGLTGPYSGTDAASMPDRAIVEYRTIDGVPTLGMVATFAKRYITLAPVADLVGLALKVEDPSKLLMTGEPGITVVLLERNHPGLRIGPRSKPLDLAFMNGTLEGEDVFIPIDQVIGGEQQVGNGWAMLMSCLSVGRSISLPSMGCAALKMSAQTVGAYAQIREQFSMPIGKFEGVANLLSTLALNAYGYPAARDFTMSMLDSGVQPTVASAILKLHCTEAQRESVNMAMDILGGKGIITGPRNFMARAYQGTPIGITVEGSNLTCRNLLIFGQGAVRCHPHVLSEIKSARVMDAEGLFKAFNAHIKHGLRLVFKNLPGIRHLHLPSIRGDSQTESLAKLIDQHALCFALSAEIAMARLGGKLKRKEMLSARLGDAFSAIFLGMSALHRFANSAQSKEEAILARAFIEDQMHRVKAALVALGQNMPGAVNRALICALARPQHLPSKALSDENRIAVSNVLLSKYRMTLCEGVYTPDSEEDSIGVLEKALEAKEDAKEVLVKVKAFMKLGVPLHEIHAHLSSLDDKKAWGRYLRLMTEAIQTDSQ